jgi:phosphatidylinositol alpha-1,6-mannosyltransferase
MIAAGENSRQEDFDREHDLNLIRLPLTLSTWGISNLTGLQGYWRALKPLWTIIRAGKVRMVHCGKCLPEGLLAWTLKMCLGLSYACYVHGEELTNVGGSRELVWLMHRVFARADFVIANSDNTRRMLRGHWNLPAKRVHLLHPGVDTERFVPADRSPACRAKLGWGERPVVLTVGRLEKRKGNDQMILALKTIRQTFPDILYVIAGAGEQWHALHELVAQECLQPHVQFLGEVDDALLIRCYQQCDMFVLPNRQEGRDFEGFGMVLLEAQACGKPVIAGASGGTAETMRIPETGRVIPCEGPDKLAHLVIEMLADRQRLSRMGAAARRWAVEQFDWSNLARKAERLFNAS